MIYYPLAKITPNLYTSGNELFIVSTGQDYRGYYFSAYDGKYFTEKTPNEASIELKKYETSTKPSSIASLGYKSTPPKDSSASSYTPVPTEDDYKNGYMVRYFIKRVNGDLSTIKEVTKDDFEDIRDNPLYVNTSLIWRLTGKIEDTNIPGSIPIPGVANANYKSIKNAEKTVPNLSQYLIDIIQYYK